MRVWSRRIIKSIWPKMLTVLTSVWFCQPSALAKPVDPAWSALSGPLGEIFIHESGHAVTMLSLGVGVSSFRPFPNICGGKFVGGCVISGRRFGSGILPFLSNNTKNVLISASGSIFSMIGALALAPQIPRTKNEFNRKKLESLTYLQVRDFPFYVLADLLGFKGDWYAVSQNLGISLWWFVPLAAGQYVALDQYWQRYHDEAVEIYEPELSKKKQSSRVYWLPTLRFKM